MDNPFSWDYLTTRPGENEVFGPFAVLYLTLFAIGFVATIIIYNGAAKKLFPNPVFHRLARKWSGIAVALFGFGLFFFGIRALQITLLTFEMRIWMWLSILSIFFLGAYVLYDYQKTYSGAMKAFEEQKQKQQYMRTSAAGAAAFPSRTRPVKRRRR